MAQDQGFIDDWSPEDTAMLCKLAQFMNLPQHRYYRCYWMTGQAVCGSLIQGLEFPEHLRSHHGIGGPDNAQLKCCWIGCFAEMKKESLIRHVNERHLEFKYICPNCPEQFTRVHTMRKHMLKEHSVS